MLNDPRTRDPKLDGRYSAAPYLEVVMSVFRVAASRERSRIHPHTKVL